MLVKLSSISIQNKMIFFQQRYVAVLAARQWYIKYFSESDRAGIPNDNTGFREEAKTNLDKLYQETKSPLVGFYFYLVMMDFNLFLGEFQKSCLMGKKLLQIINSGTTRFQKTMKAGAYSDLAENEMFIFDFKSSAQNSIKALLFRKSQNYSGLMYQEVYFRALYYQGEIEKSGELIKEILDNSFKYAPPFQYAKRSYLKACFHFVQAEFKTAFLQLQNTKDLDNDKEGWNIGKRLLTILIHLEQDDWDLAEAAITNLRMHIQRLKPEGTVRQRDVVILKVLQKLVLASFDYQQVLDKHPELFEQLDRTDREYRWQVKSPEMVVFHHWFQDKVAEVPYRFRVPEPLMKKFGAKSPAADLEI